MESTVCICGAGTMGRGIALTAAQHGFHTILFDINPNILSVASDFITQELAAAVTRKMIRETDPEHIRSRIRFSSSLEECRAPLIIEAVAEQTELKAGLFRDLAVLNSPSTIFATNTSSLSVTDIAEKTSFPERIIGLHFFNPASRMKLVELVKTRYNSDNTLEYVKRIAGQMGKTVVTCRDTPGFIVNRIARPFYLEALRIFEKNISGIHTIDQLMESAGFKMGPFHLMDLIGNDINFTVSKTLYESLDKPQRLKPSNIQETLVKNGALGKKAGQGFFQYNKTGTE